jgi:hypothetical protein
MTASCALCGPLPTPMVDDTTLWQTRLNHNQNLFGKAPDRAGATGGGAREAVSRECQELHVHVQRHRAPGEAAE